METIPGRRAMATRTMAEIASPTGSDRGAWFLTLSGAVEPVKLNVKYSGGVRWPAIQIIHKKSPCGDVRR